MPYPSRELVRWRQKFMLLNFACSSLATSTDSWSCFSWVRSHLVKTMRKFFFIWCSSFMSMPSVSLKPCSTSTSSITTWFLFGVCFRQYSISCPHFRISCLEASLAQPQPGASTRRVGRVDLILRKASSLVLPGFLLTSTNSRRMSWLMRVLLPTLLRPKKTNSWKSCLWGTVLRMLLMLHSACRPVVVNCETAWEWMSGLFRKGKNLSCVVSMLEH